jgi:hypothetical protein
MTFIAQIKDHELKMWLTRNLETLTPTLLLSMVSQVILARMQSKGSFERSILTDGEPYPETISLVNEFYASDLLRRIQDKTWNLYQKILDEEKRLAYKLNVENPQEDPFKKIHDRYRQLCYDIDT